MNDETLCPMFPGQDADASEPAVVRGDGASAEAEAVGENKDPTAEQGEEEARESDPVIPPGDFVEDSQDVD